jgi:hypothetical protein
MLLIISKQLPLFHIKKANHSRVLVHAMIMNEEIKLYQKLKLPLAE